MSSETELEKKVSELNTKFEELKKRIANPGWIEIQWPGLGLLQKRVSALEVKFEHLEGYLATVPDLPILGPNHKREYEEGKKKALAAANLA